MQKKKQKDFILGHFYIILNLEVGEKPVSLQVSDGLWARVGIWAS
jgi:hypothetical protein